MKLSEVKEKVLAGTHCILNDMYKSDKTVEVLTHIENYPWCGGHKLYGKQTECSTSIKGLSYTVLNGRPTIKVSEIDMKEEVPYTREQAEQVFKDYNSYHGWFYTKSEDEMFLNHKFPPTKKLTTEELIAYYENNEGGEVELIEKK